MPEPVTLIIVGGLVYSWIKGRGAGSPSNSPALSTQPATATANNSSISIASGTGPTAPLATTTSVINGLPLAQAGQAQPIPADLVSALDNDSALMFRAYAALNPQDFATFLDRYADNIQLHNDLYFEALTSPPPGGYQVTPGMIAAMGSAAYKVAQALNGVAVGKYGDLFGAAASAAGAIPGVSPQLVQSLQGLMLGYRAFTAGVQAMNTIGELALANGVSAIDITASLFGVGETALTTGIAAPIASLSGVLMVVGLVVDIGMTIAGDAPDVQKAIDVALDVASIVVLFIPVVGWAIAIVIQLVKFIIDLFGADLFGGGMSHEQREILETARYGENINPMYGELAGSYTPRELYRTIVQWGSGYCGGRHIVAMSIVLNLAPGDVVPVAGQSYTVTDYMTLGLADNEQAGGCYWLKGTPFERITNDEQAWALAAYGSVNGVSAMAQAGIADWRKTQFNDPAKNIIMARCVPMKNFLDHNVSLDQIDQIALEYRAQPHLNALASAYGYGTWQELFASVVATEWAVFNWTVSHGSLHDFAVQNGYQSVYAFRAAALAPYETTWSRTQAMSARIAAQVTSASLGHQSATATILWQQSNTSAP
jgi:hypothetical protein